MATKSTMIVWIAIPLFLSIAWMVLDASPSLYFYDFAQSIIVPRKHRFRSLKDKTIWITGASSGIGAELACQIYRAGAAHVILSARRVEKLAEVADGCKLRSPESDTTISILPYDAADSETTETTVEAALELTGGKPIEILFLNAGMYQLRPAMETTIDETRRFMRVNFESPVEIAQTLMRLDKWKERSYGHIVCVASIMARGGHSLSSSYAASKHALRGYFHSLSTEEFSWLRIDTVLPGAISNPNFWSSLDVASDDEGMVDVQRCVHLILTGITGPWFLSLEMWITKGPGLLWAMLSAYAPNLFNFSIHVFGVGRMALWEESGGTYDCLSIPVLIRALWRKLF